MKPLKEMLRSDFAKKVSVVMIGTLLAQGILIGSVIFLARYYSVEQFGELSFFMLVGMFAIQVMSGRYEFGVAAATSDEDAVHLVSLCFVIDLLVSLLFIGVLVALSGPILTKQSFEVLPYLPVFAIYAISYALWNAVTFYNTRFGQFMLNSTCNVLRSVVTVVVSMVLILFKQMNGMILGTMAGQATGTIILIILTRRKGHHMLFSAATFKKATLKAVAVRYDRFPKFTLPSSLVEILSGQLPQYILGTFGKTVFGWFGQANRLMNAPLDLLGQSVRGVFWETAGAAYRKDGHCEPMFKSTLLKLLVLSILPFTIIVFLAPKLFVLFLGPQWHEAGIYAQILTPMCFFRFLSNPLSSMFYIAGKQKYDLAVQATVLSLVLLVFFSPWSHITDVKIAIACYAGIYTLKYIIELYYSWRFAQGDRH